MNEIGFDSIYNEVAALLLFAVLVGALLLRLRQPLILAFIIVGILLGPSVLGVVELTESLRLFAELGLQMLLFVVGLKLDLRLIRRIGMVALATGVGQVAFTSILGYFIARGLAFDFITSVYIAVALTFSSTIIIVKLLSDKRETESLHGRIAVGLLIVQDILVILAMITLSGFVGRTDSGLVLQILRVMLVGLSLMLGVYLVARFILPRLLRMIAGSPELLLLFAIAWAVALAGLSELLGFSKEIGAFLAGVSLASTMYREILASRLVSLRDFLLLFFFVDLGAGLDLNGLGAQVWSAIPLSLFVLIGNPLIVMAIMGTMGYRKRTSFLTGLTVAQISEFSLILIALGIRLGHLGPDAASLVTLVGLITIGASTYMILYSRTLYGILGPYLGIFERPIAHREAAVDASYAETCEPDVILFGLGRYGSNVARHLSVDGRFVLGVDFDPQAVRRWNAQGGSARFGDAEDQEFPASLPLSSARWIVSSIRLLDINLALIRALDLHNYLGRVAVTAHSAVEAKALADAGADVVLRPYADAASRVVGIVREVEEREERHRMDKYISDLRDHYIVCGYGRMGKQIVKDFQRHDVPFVVIEYNPEQLPMLKEQNVPFVEGRPTEDEALLNAGADRAKGLIAVTATDEENVFIVLSARGLNPSLLIVARSILEENEGKLRRAGADRVMSPYVLGGHRIAAAVLKPVVDDVLDMIVQSDVLDLDIAELRIAGDSPFISAPVSDTGIRERAGASILMVKRAAGEYFASPSDDFIIQEGDELIVSGTKDQIESAKRILEGRESV